MKKLFFVFALALGFAPSTYAQSGIVSAQNADAISKYDGIMGHFDYALNAREHVNVNFGLTPKNPTNVAHFMIQTPDPMPFSATVTDASGKVVYTWVPSNKVYLYQADWNVSALKAGAYTVNIYLGKESKSIHQFSFTKQ